ncbi:hypothetical protein FNV43_RR24148 [Rhamnella rubrinervis]|uniref:PROP1-like PPR domain-containing protein n=1 Tax=Rhamnella rubrinervis TaxID=2594499 RepID=A0A8K0GPZ4_9ROSA|nr:hypothetical protein FNV43_RR24148 [Rhamnella rubrinervis]
MYGRRGLVNLARKVFDGMPERNIVSWNAMVMGYAKVGNLACARRLFNEMPRRDVISWTSMITGYSQAKQYNEAVGVFQEMMAANVVPDEMTVATVLSACAHLGSLDVGEAVRDIIGNHGVKVDIYIGNALIYMYLKCGVSLAVNGFADSALKLFSQMSKEGLQPTHGSFVGISLACAHAGLVDEGLEYFERMERVHGLRPEMKHYGCVVDLLSRSGNLEKAYQFIKKMPAIPDVVVWRILLSACRKKKRKEKKMKIEGGNFLQNLKTVFH